MRRAEREPPRLVGARPESPRSDSSRRSAIERVATFFLRLGLDPSQIGVITPYEGQRAYCVTHMASAGPLPAASYEAIEVAWSTRSRVARRT